MTDPAAESQRVLLYLPTVRDAEITQRILDDQGIETLACRSLAELCQEAEHGAGTALLAEEFLAQDQERRLARLLEKQPAWSDLPLLLLTPQGRPTSSELQKLQESANVMQILRPIQIEPFVNAIQSRLRDRRRQYTVRRLLESLSESERQFRQLADAMPQMVFAAGPDGTIDYFNQRTLEYVGADNAANSPGWIPCVDPRDLDPAKARWKQAIRTGRTYQTELRIRLESGNAYRWHLVRAVPVRDVEGTIVRWFGTCTEIHEQKKVQARLNRALDDSAAASIAKSEFIANMSHEIRTPMTAVLGYTQLLARDETDPEKLGFLRTIERNGSFLLELINDILDLSKIEAGKLEVHREAVTPHQLVYDVHAMMNVRAVEKNLDFSVGFETPVPRTIQSDSKRLRQILVNLVGNAIKFTEEGTVRMTVRYEGDQLQFEVSDTGIGMTEAQQDQLFQAFTQGDASVNRQYGGTGLGLAISQRLAQMLGGTISVSSKSGVGSTFTCSITAPEADSQTLVSPQETGPREEEHADTTRLNCRVLVVDDRSDVRFLAGHFLRNSGADVLFAEDGLQAARIVEEAMSQGPNLDLVLMDMQMPVMDGYQATSRLRDLGFRNPIVALTADAMQGDMDRCIASGCNAYLSKPIDSQELLTLISSLTKNGHAEQRPDRVTGTQNGD